MHEKVPGSIVMHYDSVITTGEVRWQSMLNEKNQADFTFQESYFLDIL